MFVVVYKREGVEPKIFAYQFKKGEESCGNGTKDKGIDKAFWIKGKARKSTHGYPNYHVATSSELESFFGVSGNYWTPTVWEQLKKGVSNFFIGLVTVTCIIVNHIIVLLFVVSSAEKIS